MIKDLSSTCEDCCTDSIHKAGSSWRIKIFIPVTFNYFINKLTDYIIHISNGAWDNM